MAKHNDLGKKGEAEASQFLALKGYTILDKNWRYSKFEIDIVASYKNKIIFVEVKSRGKGIWGNPEDAVTKSKIKFLAEAAEAYLNQKNIDCEIRFDIVSILFTNDSFQIDHIEEAFHPQVNS